MANTQQNKSRFSLSGKRGYIPLIVIAVGCIFISLQWLNNGAQYVRSIFVPVNHPPFYSFTVYDNLLHKYAIDDLVDYENLKQDPLLAKAINELERTSPDRILDPKGKLAFWINAYNLLVLKNICDQYPVEEVGSLQRIMSLKKHLIGGKAYSVNDIDIIEINPRLQSSDSIGSIDPMALFLICGGALGFPPLLNHAIDTLHMQTDINNAAIHFFNKPNNVFFNQNTGLMYISPFIQWHWKLLSRNFKTPDELAARYLNPGKKAILKDFHCSFMSDFNWTLNDTVLTKGTSPSSSSKF